MTVEHWRAVPGGSHRPIEQLFAKLKALPRDAAARTKDALWATTGRLLETVSESECSNYLNHCGYGAT